MKGNSIQPKTQSAHTSLCPHPWCFVRLCSYGADSICFRWWVPRLHLLFAHWLSSQELSLPFLHLLLFFCALVAAVAIQDTASAVVGTRYFLYHSQKLQGTTILELQLHAEVSTCLFHGSEWVIASAFRRASLHTEFSSLLLPYAMFLLSVQMSSRLFSHGSAFWTPHKERNCCLFRYGSVQFWVSAKQLSRRETVLFQVPGRDRCVSCQLLTLPCDISLLIGIVTMRELLPKKSIT